MRAYRSAAVAGLFGAWFCAQASLLDAVQLFAWSRMFVEYVQAVDVSTAVSETFDASKPCRICCAVRQARQGTSEPSKLPPRPDSPRLDLALVSVALDVTTPPTADGDTPCAALAQDWTPAVPTPPPRNTRA